MGWACRESTPLSYGPVMFQELVPINIQYICSLPDVPLIPHHPSGDFSKSKFLMKQERLNNLMIHKEHTDELDLKQVANDFVSNSEHRCRIFGSSFMWSFFLQQGCVWLGGCGFGLTTLKELAPGLVPSVFSSPIHELPSAVATGKCAVATGKCAMNM